MLDVNVCIDSILNVVYANALGNVERGTVRRLIFSSFSPVACAALNWKQPNCELGVRMIMGATLTNLSQL